MILSMATVTGFQHGIKEKVIGFGGHLEVSKYTSNQNYDYPLFPINTNLKDSLNRIPGVLQVHNVLTKPGIIKAEEDNSGIIMKGVDSTYDWSFLKEFIQKGKIPNFSNPKESNQVLISQYTANKLKLDVGDKLKVYFIEERVRAMAPKIVGIYKSGLEDFDKIFAIGDIRTLQRIFAKRRKEITHYEIKISPETPLEELKENFDKTLPVDLQTTFAKERNPQIYDWLDLLDLNVYIVIALMLVVAAFNIITALLILVLERVNMVGVLKALGETNWNIRNIFIYKLLGINALGLLFGNVLGIGIAVMQQQTGWIKLSQETYIVKEVMVKLVPWHIIAVNLGTILICFVSVIVASKLVSNIRPSETVKFE